MHSIPSSLMKPHKYEEVLTGWKDWRIPFICAARHGHFSQPWLWACFFFVARTFLLSKKLKSVEGKYLPRYQRHTYVPWKLKPNKYILMCLTESQHEILKNEMGIPILDWTYSSTSPILLLLASTRCLKCKTKKSTIDKCNILATFITSIFFFKFISFLK